MRLVIQAMLAVLLTVGLRAQADLPKLMQDAQPVNLQAQNTDAGDLLKMLGRTVGVEIRVAADAGPLQRLSLRFANAKGTEVFAFILEAANLTYTVVDDRTIVVRPKP